MPPSFPLYFLFCSIFYFLFSFLPHPFISFHHTFFFSCSLLLLCCFLLTSQTRFFPSVFLSLSLPSPSFWLTPLHSEAISQQQSYKWSISPTWKSQLSAFLWLSLFYHSLCFITGPLAPRTDTCVHTLASTHVDKSNKQHRANNEDTLIAIRTLRCMRLYNVKLVCEVTINDCYSNKLRVIEVHYL